MVYITVLFKKLINNDAILAQGGFLTVILHCATALSIIFIFHSKIKELLFSNTKSANRYLIKILISIIPIVLMVLFGLDEKINKKYDEGWSLMFVALMFFLTGGILLVSEKLKIKTKKITFLGAFIIGCAQAIAILPGISRSGLTICCALLLGAQKKESSTFSFLICLPIILGKTFYDIINKDLVEIAEFNFPIIIAFFVTFFIGLICCNWMIKIVNSSQLKYFAIYCFMIAVFSLSIFYFL